MIFGLLLVANKNRDYYSFLDLPHNATEREIDRSFQKLSRKYHPDKNKGNATAAEKFAEINEAYSSLRDPAKRRVYDLWGEAGIKAYEIPSTSINKEESNPDSLWNQVHKKAKTLHINFPVPLTDFYYGKFYKFDVFRRTMCRCKESGFFCDECRGRPTTSENVTLAFTVEKGSEEGTVALFKNAGDTSEIEAPGDIELIINSKPHPIFKREGINLHTDINITLKEALTGFSRIFKHLDNSDLKVVAKENQGVKDLVIKGKGMPKYMFPGEFGDLIIHPKILWPKNLSNQTYEKLISVMSQ